MTLPDRRVGVVDPCDADRAGSGIDRAAGR